MKYSGVGFLSISMMLFGCNIGPKYTPPNPEIPCEWHTEISEGMQTTSPDAFIWWESFNDPLLNSLIDRMAAQNLDLYIAASRVLEAREMRKEGNATLYPHIDGTAAYGGLGYNKKIVNKLLDCHEGSGQKNISFFEIGFDAEWEIDIFGVHRHEIEALKAKVEASKEDFRDIWVSLSAEVARNYIELRALQERVVLLHAGIENQQETLSLLQSLSQTGFKNTLEENQALTNLNILKGQKSHLDLSLRKSIHRLSVLLGHSPGELFCELSQACPLPSLPYEKPIGIPSELLMRRPDVRKAEREIAAANELVARAIAAQFPRISLRGFVGDIGALQSNGFAWFASPQLLAPIFNSRLLEQSVNVNKIKMEQAVYAYQKTVLNALEETENTLASFHHELERSTFLADAEKSSKESLELTEQLYQVGSKDYKDVLIAKRAYLDSQDAHLQSRASLILHYISLYKALGGVWSANDCK